MCVQVQGNSHQKMSKIYTDLAQYTHQNEKCFKSTGKLLVVSCVTDLLDLSLLLMWTYFLKMIKTYIEKLKIRGS